MSDVCRMLVKELEFRIVLTTVNKMLVPARRLSCGKVMFLVLCLLSVCLSTGSGGVQCDHNWLPPQKPELPTPRRDPNAQ